jgi:hypothetical protein
MVWSIEPRQNISDVIHEMAISRITKHMHLANYNQVPFISSHYIL